MATAQPTIGEKEPIEITYRPNSDSETIFANAKSKIKDHFAQIHSSATELESMLLAELEQCINTHRDIVIQVNNDIDLVEKTLTSVADAQLKTNLQMEITKLAMQKYVNIDVTVEDKLSDLMNRTISIDILMTSDTNLEKFRSSNPHPVMQYRKAVNIETLHEQVSEIKSLLAEPQYFKQDKIWYLIGRKWVEHWLNHEKNVKPVNGLIPIPPPIDNSDIMDETESHRLKYYLQYTNTMHVHNNNEYIEEELVMGRDFAIFNEAAWGKLVEWYGIKEGTVIFPRRTLLLDNKGCVDIQNISLCLYPRSLFAKFKLFPNIQFLNPTREIGFFDHDTEPEKLTAVKRVLEIPLSSEIIIFREVNNGTRIHPITNKKYTVIALSIRKSCSYFRYVPINLVAVKSKETEWLYV